MSDWKPVARTRDVVDQGPYHVSADGVDAVLVRLDGELRAFQGLCPHQGALLGEGEIVDGQLVCRNHRWCFDVDSGERDRGPQCLDRYPVREVDGRIEIDLGVVGEVGREAAGRRLEDLPGPRALPLIGNALEFDPKSFHILLEDWARDHGDMYQFSLGPDRAMAIARPELIADVLRRRPDTFSRHKSNAPVFAELGVPGVFTAEGEAWRPQRRLIMRALGPRRLRASFAVVQEVTRRLKNRWEAAAEREEVVDLQEDMVRFTVDVATRLVFSEETNVLEEGAHWLVDSISPLLPKIMQRIIALLPYWRYFKLPSDREVERGLDEVREWLSDVIARKREELEADPERAKSPRTFLEAVLTATDADGRPFDDELIFGNAIQSLIAGEDTTANTMSWAVHLLLDAPDARAKLVDAVDETLGDSAVPASMATTAELDAVDAVANETMRLKPVVPHIGFTAVRDTTVGDVEVEEGTGVVALTRMPGISPEYVDEPDRFHPGRWDDPKLLATMQRSGTFVPFGSGPRICPGRSLALLEIEMVLSMLYRNFEVERVGRSEDVDELFGFTMSPSGLRVKLRRRT
jgi:cytochrome P450/nitrite reductase/ring-hydroxylating ferredoxin subunit